MVPGAACLAWRIRETRRLRDNYLRRKRYREDAAYRERKKAASRAYGKTPEAKARRNARQRERRTNDTSWADNERRQKREYFAERYKNDPEFAARQRARRRQSYADNRDRERAYNRRRRSDPAYWAEERRRARELRRERMKDPQYRARVNAQQRRYNKTPARRQATNRRNRERYANDPDFRAKVLGRTGGGYRKHLATLLLRQGFHCALCGGIIAEEDRRHKAEVDHVVPVSKWPEGKPGVHEIENLQAVHRHCNASKGDRT